MFTRFSYSSYLIVSLLVFCSILLGRSLDVAANTEGLRYLPVQDGGRIKPFDSLSRESMSLIYGKSTFEGKLAYEVVFTWALSPEIWDSKPLFELQHPGVKEALGLDKTQRYFAAKQIMSSVHLPLLFQDLQSKRESKVKLDPYFQAVQRLESQISVFRSIASGQGLALFPPALGDVDNGKPATRWISLAEMNDVQKDSFMALTKAFVTQLSPTAEASGDALEKVVTDFVAGAQKINPDRYADLTRIKAEVHYNDFHPFRFAWFFYLLAAVTMGLSWISGKSQWVSGAWVFTLIGFALHTYGFGLRVYLSERPPVSNMYETVVWVSWGALLFSMIIEKVYRYRVTLIAGPLVAMFCLILSDLAPSILDSSLQPLQPVLRSNFWLTVHVLTITISYSAFFLAFCLGDWALAYYLRGETKFRDRLAVITTGVYRAIQIGVVLLAAGIILGGVWADYSWGRFWGWDPKETWALIALLGYLAVLHGRVGGWLKQFGLAVGAVISFSLVIMAWYGVNYVLGAGLHSYGFGAGGVEYVAAFVLAHIIYVIVTSIVRRGRQQVA